MTRVTKPEPDQEQVQELGQDGKQNPDRIDEQQERGQQCRAGDQGHAQRHDAERFAGILAALAEIEQLPDGDAEENEATGDLEIGDRDAEGSENYFAEKDESDRDREAGDQSKRPFHPPALFVDVSAEPEINRDEPDRINGDKERDEREQKFFKVRLHFDRDLTMPRRFSPSVKAWFATILLILSF
jgi:hypothetical protein